MKKFITIPFIAATALALAACNFSSKAEKSDTASAASGKFSDSQKEEIGKIAGQYIVKNPEVLIQASQELQRRQQQQMQQKYTDNVIANAAQLRNPTADAIVSGNKNGKVTLIEFYDFNCLFCHRTYPIVEAAVKNNSDVRYISRQNAIFSTRFPSSQKAAEVAYLAYRQGGAAMYNKFTASIFGNKKLEEGGLKLAAKGAEPKSDTVSYLAKQAGVDLSKLDDAKTQQQLKQLVDADKALALKLGFQGTPAIIVMPTSGKLTADNVTVIPGMPDAAALDAAIKKAAQ